MAARFVIITEEEIAKIFNFRKNIPKRLKKTTKYDLKIFQGKIKLYQFLFERKTGFVAMRHNSWSEIYVSKLFITKKNTKNSFI